MRSTNIYSRPTTASDNHDHRNVMIVGDVGAGKSSLVNLISGRKVAKTSDGAASCTLSSKKYDVFLDGVKFALHDTAGLHEAIGDMKKKEYLHSVCQAYALISELERSGGISLLVFCMAGGRISRTVQETYRLFVEVFCNYQVPVVIAVTHMESCNSMEKWWDDNERHIKQYGLKSSGHACITTTRGEQGMYKDKYDQSRKSIQKLLLEYSGQAWTEGKGSWVKRVALYMTGWLSPRVKQPGGSDLRKKLTKRCGFSVEDADFIAQKIEQSRGVSEDAPGKNKPWLDERSGTDGGRVSLPVVPYTSEPSDSES